MKKNHKTSNSFLKWAGGKGQLLKEIKSKYPKDLGQNINKYIEPFVGSGAVLFDILSSYDLDYIYISDINTDLINTYQDIKYNLKNLILHLKELSSKYLSLTEEEQKIYYYHKRERYNELKTKNLEETLEKSSLFIFLNRTCFNGLYRLNSKGLFNVPKGSYKNPKIFDEILLKEISKKLQKVKICSYDYTKCEPFIDSNTFIYFDPPYRPLNKTSSFISYTENIFDDEEQVSLANFFKKLDKKGAKMMLSNSDPKNINENDSFFDDLYKDYNIFRVHATRMINSKASSRGKITEILITNYNEFKEEKGMRNFDNWLKGFRESISTYHYYIDFEKVISNVEKLKIELNILNSLIGNKNIEHEFEIILKKYPETLKCIPLLLAVRSQEIYAQDEDGAFSYRFDTMNYSIEQYKIFMRKTGLFDLISNHLVNNLVDYALGVETGLDSNGRKNRGGHQMENLVESYIQKAGFIKGKSYFKEMKIKEIEKKFNIDLSKISNQGKTVKRFDFVVKTETMIYGIETNFYASSGSKLNETARSYKQITQESKEIEGFTFVWFTDGKGWNDARNNLRETFEILENIYNIKDMENGIIKEKFL
ncbi:DNA adenine methylase [Fusobacterium equinum]|uniref:Site-specific DNA-methyltransferase (adenine-specific) n=1 Tax=Fusobacterium equinum TaxID=134605 RepID=A0A133NB86_9FUSO|nr:DpnII family type II restriction endonuclease [Fusobacterium equinum]KXA13523.1 DNA adenine methylase [Fusobacterium equinum]